MLGVALKEVAIVYVGGLWDHNFGTWRMGLRIEVGGSASNQAVIRSKRVGLFMSLSSWVNAGNTKRRQNELWGIPDLRMVQEDLEGLGRLGRYVG